MEPIFPAHIRTDEAGEPVQTAQAHCRAAAVYASAALDAVGLRQSAYLAGLLHDCGKFTDAFRRYLTIGGQPRGSVNHTFAGVRLLLSTYHGARCETHADVACELLAYAVGAHHGLFDCVDARGKNGFQHRLERPDIPYEEAVANFLERCAARPELDALFRDATAELTPVLTRAEEMARRQGAGGADELCFYLGLTARLLLSAVIEGDRRDTAEFLHGARLPTVTGEAALWSACLERVEARLKTLEQTSDIQRARAEISRRCRAFADRPGGVYRLHVPTGAGKTLSSLRYALAHAARWNKSRILFISPLLSILEQNAAVIRRFVQDDAVILEHHSNVVHTEQTAEQLDANELLAENWSAPIVITTLVQLLNTLFDGRTTSIRRFQALCGSVIVIDEVQTVPSKLLTMFYLAVNFLSEICGATVLLCSATQPCQEKLRHPLLREPETLVPYDPALWAVFRRTVLLDAGSRRLEEIPAFTEAVLEEADSALIVCNKRAEAAFLHRQLSARVERCFHLSAAMCAAHRRDTLAEIERSLACKGQKTVCASTQVAEAGVDISFARSIRLTAGMDNAVQTSGRCNRNGEQSEAAPVYLLQCENENLSRTREILQAKQATERLLADFRRDPEPFDGDLSSDAAIRTYYRYLYLSMPEGQQDYAVPELGTTLFSLLSLNSALANRTCEAYGRFCLNQAFRLAGDLFTVFDEETDSVLVPYGDGAALISELCSERAARDPVYAGQLLERAKPYTVSIYRYQKQALLEKGALRTAWRDGLFLLEPEYYDEALGLVMDPGDMKYLEV